MKTSDLDKLCACAALHEKTVCAQETSDPDKLCAFAALREKLYARKKQATKTL